MQDFIQHVLLARERGERIWYLDPTGRYKTHFVKTPYGRVIVGTNGYIPIVAGFSRKKVPQKLEPDTTAYFVKPVPSELVRDFFSFNEKGGFTSLSLLDT